MALRQDEQYLVKEAFEYYSLISNPSFTPFAELLEKEPAKFLLNPYTREALLGNLKGINVKITEGYYHLINMCHTMKDIDPQIDLNESANYFAREALTKLILSSGTDQALLKTLLTQYTISEQRAEEKIWQDIRQKPPEQDKKGLFGFSAFGR